MVFSVNFVVYLEKHIMELKLKILTFFPYVKIYPDPFRGGDNILVMCETYKYNKQPTETNKRKTCNEVMERAKASEPWFGIEQVKEIINMICLSAIFW